ncbi:MULTISPECIES: family 43 glycosylhydrolase [unclassified Aeromicrobium]|jgi:hypothetical protein|uniref:family 43 glycosylhydrolase n=1 Tax=unclassified Aeromicrobium TaxID=2633570 RepID=UPI000A717CC0|nr:MULTISPECIES: family 43 glycosylhydrolase [unclassified Aeromicrobium]
MRTGRIVVAVATALVLAAVPATGASPKKPNDWLKPGVPLQGQQHPDPSAVSLGPYVLATSTNHGGSDLPFVWSGDLSLWTARTQYADGNRTRDGEGRGFFNDGIDAPRWGSYASCTETPRTRSGCDPREMWAPGFDFVGGRWVLFSAVKVSDRYSSYGRFAIYRAASSVATGLYSSVSSSPIVRTDTRRDPAGVIDPEVFTDPANNRSYLLYKTEGNLQGNLPTLWSRRLDSSGTRFLKGSKPVRLLTTPRGSWEGRVVENPSMAKVNGVYVLFYSGNEYTSTRYATGYAVCKRGPSAPCTRPGSNRLLTSARGSYGPGGADALTDARGRHLLAYHAYPTASGSTGTGGRTLRTAEFTVDPRTKRVSIRQRAVAAAPGREGGTWFGGNGAFTRVKQDASGAFVPFVADLNHDGIDDVGYYGGWGRADAARLGAKGARTLQSGSAALVRQAGAFVPVSGDFDGDGHTDVYWYQPGADPHNDFLDPRNKRHYEPNARRDELWLSRAGGWQKIPLAQDRTAVPIVANVDGRPGDELWWYVPGKASDERWTWDAAAGTMARRQGDIPGPGTTAPAVADFDADGFDDLLWYVPGQARATVWWKGSSAARTSFAVDSATRTAGRVPVAGDFDRSTPGAEVLWYGPRSVSEVQWSTLRRTGTPKVTSVRSFDGGAVYQAVVGDYDGDGTDDISWFG